VGRGTGPEVGENFEVFMALSLRATFGLISFRRMRPPPYRLYCQRRKLPRGAGLLGFAIRTGEIILAVCVDNAALCVVEKSSRLHAAVIVHVNFFRPIRGWSRGLCSDRNALEWLSKIPA
jgi:hypothetical protein